MSEAIIKDFPVPEILKNRSVNQIHDMMLGMLPNYLDKSEGQIPHDFTWPTAMENAELFEFVFPMMLKSIHPMWAMGKQLDNCGDSKV